MMNLFLVSYGHCNLKNEVTTIKKWLKSVFKKWFTNILKGSSVLNYHLDL